MADLNKIAGLFSKKRDKAEGEQWAKNTFLNRVFNRRNILEQQIREGSQPLKSKIPLRNMFVDYATGADSETLAKANHNPEFISPEEGLEDYTTPDGQVVRKGKMQISADGQPLQTVTVKHPGKYTTLINKEALAPGQIKSAAANDYISHALHGDKNYELLSSQLSGYLKQKYPEEMINGNGGVDAYMRGVYDVGNPEYEPYRKEMSHIPPAFLNQIRGYIQKGKLK